MAPDDTEPEEISIDIGRGLFYDYKIIKIT